MARRKKTRRDTAEIARDIVERVIGEPLTPCDSESTPPTDDVPEQSKRGRAGGCVGGKARAANLSPARRQEIAKKAAEVRWSRRARDD